MSEPLRAVSIDYVLNHPRWLKGNQSEEHTQKAVAALEHLEAIGLLMHLVEVSDTDQVAKGFNEHRLKTLAKANRGIGSLIAMLADGAISEIYLITDSK